MRNVGTQTDPQISEIYWLTSHRRAKKKICCHWKKLVKYDWSNGFSVNLHTSDLPIGNLIELTK